MKFIFLKLTLVVDSRRPTNLVTSIHFLVNEDSLIRCRSLLVNSFAPRTILEGALEPALASRIFVLNRAISHISSLKDTFVDCFTIWELQSALSMPLVHLIDLTVICSTIAVGDVLLW